MPYIDADKKNRLVVPFGELNAHSGSGKLIRYKAVAEGSTLNVVLQLAIAKGKIDSVVKAAYDGIDIPASNYEFFDGGSVPNQTYFPNDVGAGAAFINVKLLDGMAEESEPDKLVIRFKGSHIEDYNSSGAVTGTSYSANPGRAAVYGVDLITGETNQFDWGAFAEYKAWCDETITITKDGVSKQVPRFRFDNFITPGVTRDEFLDLIALQTCSGWQTGAGGKIRLIAANAANHTPSFDFQLTNLTKDYQFQPGKIKGYNGVEVFYRNLDDELLKEVEKPITIKRPDLIALNDGVENFLQYNYGVGYQDQVERFANYLTKIHCDLTDTASFRSSFAAYPVLPEDLTTVTHTTPGWAAKKVRIIKKTEKEDRESVEGVEEAGYDFIARVEPTNPYSDTDFTPIITRTPGTRLNPFNAPPAVTGFAVSGETLTEADGSLNQTAVGSFVFGNFGFKQRAVVLHQRPGDIYRETLTLDSQTNFRIENLGQGTHYFKVVVYSGSSVMQTEALAVQTLTVTPNPFRSGEFIGRDTGRVDAAIIRSRILSQIVSQSGQMVSVRIAAEFISNLVHNNTDSVKTINIDVIDQFGDIVEDNAPQNCSTQGGVFQLDFRRKYADALEGQAYFAISVQNTFGDSNIIYLRRANGVDTLSAVTPTYLLKSACPKDFAARVISAREIHATWVFTANVDIYKRLIESEIKTFTKHNDAAILGSPSVLGGFSAYTGYECYLAAASDPAKRSNIIEFWTQSEGASPPSRPVPTAPSATVDQTAPTSKLNFSCTSAANVETEVHVYNGSSYVLDSTLPAVAVGSPVTFSISGLSQNTTKSVKFRHKWAAGDFSSLTEAVTATTNANTSAGTKPKNLQTVVEVLNDFVEVYFSYTTDNPAPQFTVQKRIGSTGTIETLTSTLTATSITDNNNDFGIEQFSYSYKIYYRVKDNTLTAAEGEYTDWKEATIPPTFNKTPGGVNSPGI